MLKSIFSIVTVLIFIPVFSFAGSYTNSYTTHDVVRVEEIYEKRIERIPIHTHDEIICERSHTGKMIGGIGGGIGGYALGKGKWKILTTPLGIVTGSSIGHHFDRHEKSCVRVPVHSYREKITHILTGYRVYLDNGETFITSDYYKRGDMVRKKVTFSEFD